MTEFLRFIRKVNFVKIFFVLSFLFLPTQLGKHFWPPFSFILGSRIDYLSPTIYISDIFIIAFIVATYWKEKIFFPPRIAFFLVFLAMGIYFSLSPLAGWYGFLKFTELLLFSFAIRKFLSKNVYLHLLSVLFSILIIIESVIAFLQFLNHGSLGGIFYLLGERMFNSTTPGIANASINGQLVLRPYATFPHPNVLAGFLLIGMTVVIGGLAFAKNNWEKIIFISSLVLGTIALLISFSRLATIFWLFLLIYFCIYLVSQKEFHKETTTIVVLFSIICIFFIGAISFPHVAQHILTTSFLEESVSDRINLSVGALQMTQKNPIFGVGLNNFLQNLTGFIKISNLSLLQPVHNIFLLTLAQVGFVGFGFVLWFLYRTIEGLFIVYRKVKEKERFPIVISFFALATIITLGMVDHYFLTLQQGQLLFAFVLALCWVNISSKELK